MANLNHYIFNKLLFTKDNIIIQSEEWQLSLVCWNLKYPVLEEAKYGLKMLAGKAVVFPLSAFVMLHCCPVSKH